MKVKELIKQLKQTDENNEVRLINDEKNDYVENLYLSFDDVGDVIIYEVEEEDLRCEKCGFEFSDNRSIKDYEHICLNGALK